MTPNYPPGPPENFRKQIQQVRQDFLGYLRRSAQTYGDVVRLNLGPGYYIYLLNHPDYIREVLVERANLFHKSKSTRQMVGKFLGNGLILSEDDFHKRQRRLVQPAFHARRIEAYAGVMVDYTRQMAEGFSAGQVVEVEAEMTHLTLRIVAKTLFDADIRQSSLQIGLLMGEFAEAMSSRFRSLPLPEWIPTPAHRRQRRAIAEMDAIIHEIITQRRAEGEDRGDLISMLLLAVDEEEGDQMDDRQARDEIVTLFFAGHETTAKLLTWTLYLLSQHPAVETEALAELTTQLQGQPPTMADINRLPYLDKTLKEVLRLYPPAWVFDRMPLEDYVVGGYTIPAGKTIYISPYVTHQDGRFFDQPERFNPNRFEPGYEKDLPRYAYFPFGGGPRVCIGQAFAVMEAKLVLATLLPRYRFALEPNQEIVPEPFATLRPKNGLNMRLEIRD